MFPRYIVQVLRFDPHLLGWPMRRPRKYTILLRRDTFQWLGSAQEFEKIHSKKCALSPMAFLCMPAAELAADIHAAATLACKMPSDGSEPDPMQLRSPGQRRRAAAADELAAASAAAGEDHFQSGMFADIMQAD